MAVKDRFITLQAWVLWESIYGRLLQPEIRLVGTGNPSMAE